MKQLLVFSLSVLIGILTDFCSSSQINGLKNENYRLNTDVIPFDYIVDVTPYFDINLNGKKPFTFDGVCTITVKANKPNIDTITLHKQYLDIVEQSLTTAPNSNTSHNQMVAETIDIESNEYNNVTSKYTLKLTEPLVQDKQYVLKFKYTGKLQTDYHGLFYISYQEGNSTRWLATTHFEHIHARKMFPCFDEPQFRATFSMIVNRPAHFKPTLSNTRLISSRRTPSNLVREYFEKTPPMPTYLVAIVISELECRENEAKNYSFCYRPSAYDQSGYSFEMGQRVQQTYDVLFDYKYSTHMKKLTIAAIPQLDPTIGGIENWGLVTCQEYGQLIDPKSWTIKKQEDLVMLDAHEVGHMWFGDIVTVAWWNNFWQKESFAEYFAYFGTAVFEPTWGMNQKFLIEQMYTAFDDDSLESSWALDHDANTPEELKNKYGSISYNKGASVIRMFNHTIGDDKFTAAIRRYFKANALTAAVPERLYEAFQKEVGNDLNISETWGSWVTQPGYPVLNVRIASDRKHIEITQKRFLRNNPNHQLKQLWKVPLTYASNNHNSDFSYMKPVAIMSNESMQIDLKEPVEWIIFNVQQSGYYRVNYDDESWSTISNLLHKSHSTVHVLNRAQITNDALNLARASLLSYKQALQIVSYLRNDVDYAPWMAAFPNFEFILARFKPSEASIFEEFVLKLLNRAYEHYGFEGNADETHLENFVRKTVLKYACLWGHKGCIARARSEYDRLVQRNASVHVDISPPVYCSAIEHGSETEWNYLWNKFKKSIDVYEKMSILESLGCTRQTHSLKKYLNLVLSDEVPIKLKTKALPSTWRQKQNHDLVIDFILARHKDINSAFASDTRVVTTLIQLASVLTNSEQIDRIQKFVNENELASNENLKVALENAHYNLKWADRNVPVIKDVVQQCIQVSNKTTKLLKF